MSKLWTTLAIDNLAPGATVTVAHELNENGVALRPNLIMPDRSTPIAVIPASVDELDVSFTNLGANPESAIFLIEVTYSTQRDPDQLDEVFWQGGPSLSGGGSGQTAYKAPARAATTGPVGLAGLGAIDGVALAAGDRVLVKDQGGPAANGIYIAAVGAWTRAPDANVSAELIPAMLVPIEEGAVNGDTTWQLTTDAPITLGVTPLTFRMIEPAGVDGSIVVDGAGIRVGVLATDGQHGNRGGGALHALATPAAAGFLSAADKQKIDDLPTGFDGTAQTVGLVTATAATYTPPDNKAISIIANVVARNGAVPEARAEVLHGTFRRTGGVTTQAGSTSVVSSRGDGGTAPWGMTFDTSGADIRVRVTGQAGKTIDWDVEATIAEVP